MVVHGENHFLILVVLEIIVILRIVALPSFNGILDEDDGRIILFLILFFTRFDHHLL